MRIGSTGSSARFVRISETALVSEVVADGSYDFELGPVSPRSNLMEYFFFVDSNGDPVDATTGTVSITFSPILPLFQKITNGDFLASMARDPCWPKPNGFGKALSVRITLLGITGAPTGFRSLGSQTGL